MKVNVTKLSIGFIALLVGIYIAYHLGVAKHLTLEKIKVYSDYFQYWVAEHYLFSVLVYMLAYFVVIASSLPATGPMSMLGGFLFGTWPTIIYSTIAATFGATVAFLLFRTVLRGTVEQKYASQLQKFRSGLKEHGAWYLLLLHFLFVIPFFVINILAALGGVTLWQFVWTTAVGFLPCAFVYAFAGTQLKTIQSVGDIFSFKVIAAIIFVILLSLIPIVYKRIKKCRG